MKAHCIFFLSSALFFCASGAIDAQELLSHGNQSGISGQPQSAQPSSQFSGVFEQKVAQFRQILSSQGIQGDALLFADEKEVAIISYAQNFSQTQYAVDFFSGAGQYSYSLAYRGQDARGNLILSTESGSSLILAQDRSWLQIADLKRMNSATASACNRVLEYSIRREKEIRERYWLFEEFFGQIKQGFNAGIDDEQNLMLYTDGKELLALARIPRADKYVMADYLAWNTTYFNVNHTSSAGGGHTFAVFSVENGQQVGVVDVSQDWQQLRSNGRTFQRTTVEKASAMVDEVRLNEDRHRSYEDFERMYITWSNLYANKLEYVNNVNIKETYKFSARAQMADCQAKMREIRQRAARVGYNIMPGAFEGASNTAVQSDINNYQSARDGVRYGVDRSIVNIINK